MKKYLLIVTVFALGLSIVACTGKKSENANANEEVKQEEVAPAADSVNGDVLAKYEILVNKAIELQGKLAGGDAAAAQELAQVGQDIAAMASDLANAAANFTPEQAQKYEDLAKKWTDAALINQPQ